MKYVYSYETVNCEMDGWGPLGGNVYKTMGYRKVIQQKASTGWRYVGWIPTKQRGTSQISEIDLIFEKEEQ